MIGDHDALFEKSLSSKDVVEFTEIIWGTFTVILVFVFKSFDFLMHFLNCVSGYINV